MYLRNSPLASEVISRQMSLSLSKLVSALKARSRYHSQQVSPWAYFTPQQPKHSFVPTRQGKKQTSHCSFTSQSYNRDKFMLRVFHCFISEIIFIVISI